MEIHGPEIVLEQVRLQYKQASIAAIALLVNAAIVVPMLWQYVPHSRLATWICAIYPITFFRYLQFCTFCRSEVNETTAVMWKRRYIGLSFVSGLSWGCMAVFLYPESSLIHQMFIAFVLVAMCAGATAIGGEKGTGLGLPYAADIIKAHGGELTAESAKGEGSVFYIRLPEKQNTGGAESR